MLVTHSGLTLGYQAVQPAHALAQFAMDYPTIFEDWQQNHKNLIVLAAKDESHLMDLWIEAKEKGINVSFFREPDIGHELTAIALAPG